MKNVLVLQSGGPTAAINATVAGVVERGLISDKVDKIYGALYGIKGVIGDNLVELGELLSSPSELSKLVHTPSAALGSCRIKLPDISADEQVYANIFNNLKKHNIGYMVCIGGNDSMDTVNKLSAYAKLKSIPDIYIMGGPKTIDNDLCCMDHSPGFASAARYVATTFCEIWSDCHVYNIPAVTIVEIMGRHTGWLTASAALATNVGRGPDFIYLPETSFDNDRFLADVTAKLKEQPAVIVAVSEGIKYADGRFISEEEEHCSVDAFGHKQLAGTSLVLEALVRREIGCKVRSVEFNIMQRASSHLASALDLAESKMLGATALDRALSGISGQVSVLNRLSSNPYRVKYSSVPADQIANLEKHVPTEWINDEGNGVTKEMLEYLLPLVTVEGEERYDGGLPSYQQFIK